MAQLIRHIHHVELVVGNAKQAAYYYRKAFGFDQVAYRGPETGCPERVSYLLEAGRDLVRPDHAPAPRRSVGDLVDAARGRSLRYRFGGGGRRAAFAQAVAGRRGWSSWRRGGRPVRTVQTAAVNAYGEVIHSFVQRGGYRGFLPGFEMREVKGNGTGLTCIDHIVGNVDDRQMDRWVSWYDRTLGLSRFVSYDDKDISTEFTALRSTVVASKDRAIKFPINEPADGRRKSQIQEYIDANLTAGVQHLALPPTTSSRPSPRCAATASISCRCRRVLRDLWDRVGEIGEDRGRVQDLGSWSTATTRATCCSCSPSRCRTGRRSSSRSSSGAAATASARATSRPCSRRSSRSRPCGAISDRASTPIERTGGCRSIANSGTFRPSGTSSSPSREEGSTASI